MLVYLSVMFLCCVFLFFRRNATEKIVTLAITFGMIWLMVALQDGWGGDHDNYVDAFEWLKGQPYSVIISSNLHGELGYKLFMSMMPSEHFGFVVCMAIWCFSLAFFFFYFIPQKWWFLAILFVFFDRAILMGMVASYARMAIANSFLIYAVYNVLNRKVIIALGLILLGAFFHRSILFMLPLAFFRGKRNKLSMPIMLVAFVFITVIAMIAPSSWIKLVEGIVSGVDALESYSLYFEEAAEGSIKGLILIILFYWIFLLAKTSNKSGLRSVAYLMIYYALIRIAFDLLPAFGLSTRFFYYIDIYFFAGMMCVMDCLPKRDINKVGITISLLLIFLYTGFWQQVTSEHFLLHWAIYNPIF